MFDPILITVEILDQYTFLRFDLCSATEIKWYEFQEFLQPIILLFAAGIIVFPPYISCALSTDFELSLCPIAHSTLMLLSIEPKL